MNSKKQRLYKTLAIFMALVFAVTLFACLPTTRAKANPDDENYDVDTYDEYGHKSVYYFSDMANPSIPIEVIANCTPRYVQAVFDVDTWDYVYDSDTSDFTPSSGTVGEVYYQMLEFLFNKLFRSLYASGWGGSFGSGVLVGQQGDTPRPPDDGPCFIILELGNYRAPSGYLSNQLQYWSQRYGHEVLFLADDTSNYADVLDEIGQYLFYQPMSIYSERDFIFDAVDDFIQDVIDADDGYGTIEHTDIFIDSNMIPGWFPNMPADEMYTKIYNLKHLIDAICSHYGNEETPWETTFDEYDIDIYVFYPGEVDSSEQYINIRTLSTLSASAFDDFSQPQFALTAVHISEQFYTDLYGMQYPAHGTVRIDSWQFPVYVYGYMTYEPLGLLVQNIGNNGTGFLGLIQDLIS